MRQVLKHMAVLLAALSVSALLALPAQAAFGLKEVAVKTLTEESTLTTQAGSHPYAIETDLAAETEVDPDSGKVIPAQDLKDLKISFPPGLVGNPYAVPRCPMPMFLAGEVGECTNASAVGVAHIEFGIEGGGETPLEADAPVYNLEPSRGTVARLGFIVAQRAPVTIEVGVNPDSPNNVVARSTNISQALFFRSAALAVWGNPADSSHDPQRGACARAPGICPVDLPEIPFLTLPASCSSPLTFGFEADSWQNPSGRVFTSASVGEPGAPLSPTGCEKLTFTPEISAQPTTSQASSSSGLDFNIDVDDPGLVDPQGRSQAMIEKAIVSLPTGVTLNPSAAAGLGACSEERLARESAMAPPGAGCPEDSKVGNVEVETPLLEGKLLRGSLYVATPFENSFNSLVAIYMVIKDPELGILIKLPGKVSLDAASGQITTTFGEEGAPIPQVPFSHFRFHFRSGARAPLVTPPSCGTFVATATLTPSTGAAPHSTSTPFTIGSGPNGGPCPSGASPFAPAFEAGSLNNAAGTYSPFFVGLSRSDGEQELTRFSLTLPPGLTGKIAGLERCPQSAIDAAKLKSARVELAASSCPSSSRIGHLTSGVGVGSSLTYVPGSLYLAGPFHGAPLSVAAIVPAQAGPFDVGTVVVQEGLDLNPVTSEAQIDGSASEPIPRILAGVPLRLRDLRVHADRPGFTLNPTSCEVAQVRAILTGEGSSATPTARYEASSCASLPFKPELSLKLSGGMKRTGHPAVASVLRARPGDANIGAATVLLPRTEIIDNAHIDSPCTRVQFNADACPPSSILGYARAFTPLLDQPLEGPVYLRSNGGERQLPDLVADLHGQFRIILVGFIDAKHARIRTRFMNPPDAPISRFVLKLSGGKNGLLQNTTNLCAHERRARQVLVGQNGRRLVAQPRLGTSCGHK